MEKSQDRLQVLENIKKSEAEGRFNDTVENDPPTITLMPDKVDYLNEKLGSKIKTKIANKMATKFYETLIKNGQFIIKEVKGMENFTSVQGGAIITCNHFNACDNYAVYRVIKSHMGKRKLYKVIREGNYTNFPGPIGFFFKHCNTLPLSSNSETMKKFMVAVRTLLGRGEKILIYPEQAMWWNYRKPRPLKDGAFRFAFTNNVPVIPVFITMEDTETIGQDGFPIQAYTVNFLEPIYPDMSLSKKDNIEMLKNKNYEVWVKTYEEFYNKKLTYENE